MDHLIGGFDGLLPYAKEIERCGTSGQMFKALAYCNQRYINSLKLVRDRLEDADTEDEIPEGAEEMSDMEDEMDTGSEDEDQDPLSRKEKNVMGLESLNDIFLPLPPIRN